MSAFFFLDKQKTLLYPAKNTARSRFLQEKRIISSYKDISLWA